MDDKPIISGLRDNIKMTSTDFIPRSGDPFTVPENTGGLWKDFTDSFWRAGGMESVIGLYNYATRPEPVEGFNVYRSEQLKGISDQFLLDHTGEFEGIKSEEELTIKLDRLKREQQFNREYSERDLWNIPAVIGFVGGMLLDPTNILPASSIKTLGKAGSLMATTAAFAGSTALRDHLSDSTLSDDQKMYNVAFAGAVGLAFSGAAIGKQWATTKYAKEQAEVITKEELVRQKQIDENSKYVQVSDDGSVKVHETLDEYIEGGRQEIRIADPEGGLTGAFFKFRLKHIEGKLMPKFRLFNSPFKVMAWAAHTLTGTSLKTTRSAGNGIEGMVHTQVDNLSIPVLQKSEQLYSKFIKDNPETRITLDQFEEGFKKGMEHESWGDTALTPYYRELLPYAKNPHEVLWKQATAVGLVEKDATPNRNFVSWSPDYDKIAKDPVGYRSQLYKAIESGTEKEINAQRKLVGNITDNDIDSLVNLDLQHSKALPAFEKAKLNSDNLASIIKRYDDKIVKRENSLNTKVAALKNSIEEGVPVKDVNRKIDHLLAKHNKKVATILRDKDVKIKSIESEVLETKATLDKITKELDIIKLKYGISLSDVERLRINKIQTLRDLNIQDATNYHYDKTIIGTPVKVDIVGKADAEAKSLLKREVYIDHSLLTDYLDNNFRRSLIRSIKEQTVDIAVTKHYGDHNFDKLINEVIKEVDELSAKDPSKASEYVKIAQENLTDFFGGINRLKGYAPDGTIKNDFSHVAANILTTLSTVGLMGASAASNVPEAFTVAKSMIRLQDDTVQAFKDIVGTTTTKLNKSEKQRLGFAIMSALQETRLNAWDGVTGSLSKVDELPNKIKSAAYIAYGQTFVTNVLESLKANHVLDIVSKVAVAGEKAAKQDIDLILSLGFKKSELPKIAEQFKKYAVKNEDGTITNAVSNWEGNIGIKTRTIVYDEVRKNVISKDVLTNPLWFDNSALGKAFGQFKGFMFTAMEKYALTDLQKGGSHFATMLLVRSVGGMFAYLLRMSLLRNWEDIDTDPKTLFHEGLMRGGGIIGMDFLSDLADMYGLGIGRMLGTNRAMRRKSAYGNDPALRTLAGASATVIGDVTKTITNVAQGNFDPAAYRHLVKYPFGHFALQGIINRVFD